MKRRQVLRRSGAAATALSTAGLAGCASDSDGSTGTTTTGEPSPDDEHPEDTGAASVRSVSNGIAELEIVGLRSFLSGDEFVTRVTVENTGRRRTSVMRYAYRLTLYDASGAEIPTTGYSKSIYEMAAIAPGESVDLDVGAGVGEDRPVGVNSYDLAVNCRLYGTEPGVYCPGSA